MLDNDFTAFLIEAKRNTYAAGAPPTGSSRKQSKDLGFSAGEYEYLDSYFGASDFIGEEIVYRGGRPIWGMNYHGRSIADADSDRSVEDVGMGDMLHAALKEPPRDAPYRGPRSKTLGDCEYRCSWQGALDDFSGEEEILYRGKRVYSLRFHGGAIA
jgi:hypothetical protein